MQRHYVFGSVLLFSASCAPRIYTPASSAAFWAEEKAPGQSVSLPDYSYAAAAWQLPPENPWSPYAKATLLSSLNQIQSKTIELPDVNKITVVNNALAAAGRVAELGLPEDAMWVVDLRGPAAVAFGTSLSQRTALPVAVVPTFNNWPADDELVPAEETLAAMVSMFPRRPLPEEVAARPIFLLDAWRLAYRNETVDDDTYDNRYFLNSSDLPDVQRLQAQGITRVIYVVESLNTVTNEEEDLHAVFLAYQQAGITIHLVDLEWLAGYPQQLRWTETLPLHILTIVPRTTILDDSSFFGRSRGGFGGIYAHPSRSRYGFSHSHSHSHSHHHSFGGRGG